MKNLKLLLIPIGLIALVIGIFSFSTYNGKDGDKKCTIKIVKIINGEETVIDSTFDCDEDMSWINCLHAGLGGDSIHKMIKVMMLDGDSGECNFNFDFDSDEENGMGMMKISGDDGEDVEMKIDCKMMDGKDGVMKMMINGKEMEIKLDDCKKMIEKLHKHIGSMDDESGNVEITIDSGEDGEEAHTVKIIKTVDDDGKVTMKKIVDGKETEIDASEMHKMHCKDMKTCKKIKCDMDGAHKMKIDVQVDEKDGKHMVIITKITSENKEELAKKNPAVKSNLKKKELAVENLNFSPNPNNGKFDLQFKLDKKQAVQIKIFDIQGKEVYNEKVSDFDGKYSHNIDISENGEGIYLLQIIQGDKASTNKIVIK